MTDDNGYLIYEAAKLGILQLDIKENLDQDTKQ